MLKQSPSRNQRTKGFKVKQGFQIFILVAIGIWLIYQLKHSHDKKNKVVHETNILGRKGFHPLIKKPYELIDDTDESRPERVKEHSGGGGGDDDIVGHDRERVEEEEPEEVEDLIDEEDKEKEEENEDDNNLLEDLSHGEGEKDRDGTSEKHYRGNNGASRRKLKEEVENSENQQKNILPPRTYLSPEVVVDNVGIEHGSSLNALLKKGKEGVLSFADSGSRSSNSDSLLNTEFD